MPVRVVETSSALSHPSGGTSGNTLPSACTLLSVGQRSYDMDSISNEVSEYHILRPLSDLVAYTRGVFSGCKNPEVKQCRPFLKSHLQAFSGTQNVSSQQKDEAWRVNVRIQGCDLDHGYLCGTMEALNVPMADTPVVTFWEGEIVDTKNYTFFTGKWGATSDDDIKHWTKFPSFSPLLSQVEVDGGKSLDLSNYPYIFMRWKEQYFVNVGTDCGLTIAGFYYVCFSCSDGSINGFYYDPNSSPFQKLELKSTNEGRLGFSFSSYELQ
ncbi:putative delta-1-pyrroline-5-carboxylate synthase-like isoform X1 [Capsicum annuum]|nr:putative delta-1-pyrroline-5-carboxylate synthase-like isoform X1 [Capsicum annuum]